LILLQNGGSYVLAVDSGREAILSVWQWQWGHLLGKVAVRVLSFSLPRYSLLIFICWRIILYTHTHTHTHIYIYVYI